MFIYGLIMGIFFVNLRIVFKKFLNRIKILYSLIRKLIRGYWRKINVRLEKKVRVFWIFCWWVKNMVVLVGLMMIVRLIRKRIWG